MCGRGPDLTSFCLLLSVAYLVFRVCRRRTLGRCSVEVITLLIPALKSDCITFDSVRQENGPLATRSKKRASILLLTTQLNSKTDSQNRAHEAV